MTIDDSAETRPTRQRLFAAMGVSTCALAALLSLIQWSEILRAGPPLLSPQPLIIAFERPELEVEPEPLPEETLIPEETPMQPASSSTEPTEAPVEPEAPEPSVPDEPEPDDQPPTDWTAVSHSTVRSYMEDARRAEDRSDAMWRQSYSLMFEPRETLTVEEAPPPIDGFRFEPEFRVLGVGLKIGNCFFGIPILGVPVEQRSVGPNVIVCAQRSD